MKLKDIANQYLNNKFTFDEESGSVIDLKSFAVGTITGATRVAGWNGEGKALSFPNPNSYVAFNSTVFPLGKMSVRFKVKALPTSTNSTFIGNIGAYSTAHKGYQFLFSSTGILNINYWNGSASVNNISSNVVVADGQWHDVLFVWDGTTNTGGLRLYIDDMTTPHNVATANTTSISFTTNLYLGTVFALIGQTGRNLNGELDELEIYNTELDKVLYGSLMCLKNPSTNQHYSLAEKTLIPLPNASSKNMILHGVEAGKEIQLDEAFDKIQYISELSTATQGTNGKIVTQKLLKMPNKILKLSEVRM